MTNRCPKCGLSDIHICHIISSSGDVINEPNEYYTCNLCNNSWTDLDEIEPTIESEECYWCTNYHSANAGGKLSSFFVGVPDPLQGLKLMDPKFCPICGKPMNTIEEQSND